MAEQQTTGARDAARAADLLVTAAESLNERLAVTADELARSQAMLREASAQLLVAFRGAADRIVAAQQAVGPPGSGTWGGPPGSGTWGGQVDRADEYGVVLDHLYRAVQHIQSHDLVDQLIDAQKTRVDKMREKLGEALSLAVPPVADPLEARHWIERSRAMLDCIVAGIRQIDDDARGPVRTDKQHAGSVDLF